MWPSFQGGILGDGVARRVRKSYKGYMKCHKSVKIHFKYYYGIQADDTSYCVFKAQYCCCQMVHRIRGNMCSCGSFLPLIKLLAQ